MAIVHADNFSIYGDDEALMLNGVYSQTTSVNLVVDPDGVSPGRVAALGNGATLRYALPAANTVVGVSARIWLTALPISPTVYIALRDGSNNNLWRLGVTTTGGLAIINSSNVTVYTTAGPVITANGWYHIEWKYVADAAAGSHEVRVEGVTVIEQTSLNTGTTPIAQIALQSDSLFNFSRWKDYVLWDGAGTYNTDFLGSVLVSTLLPTADVALNWTPSTGTDGFSILDNIPPTADYLYAEDVPLPSPYVGELSDLPPDITSVKAVVTYVRAAKSDGGDGSLQVGIISDPDGTPATALGADRPITTAQTYWRDFFEEDPATSAPWLPAAVDEAQIQLNRTT